MSPLAIVEHLDVLENGIRKLDTRLPLSPVEKLDLHRRPERFHHRVIKPIADSSKRWKQTRSTNLVSECPRRELDSMIGMDNSTGDWRTCPDGHIERVDNERRILLRVDRPADNFATTRVKDRRAEHLSFSSRMLRDISDPELVQ